MAENPPHYVRVVDRRDEAQPPAAAPAVQDVDLEHSAQQVGPPTGGESTENEMFVLIGNFYDPINFIPGFGIGQSARRSTFTGLALPPARACGTMHGMHEVGEGAHAGH